MDIKRTLSVWSTLIPAAWTAVVVLFQVLLAVSTVESLTVIDQSACEAWPNGIVVVAPDSSFFPIVVIGALSNCNVVIDSYNGPVLPSSALIVINGSSTAVSYFTIAFQNSFINVVNTSKAFPERRPQLGALVSMVDVVLLDELTIMLLNVTFMDRTSDEGYGGVVYALISYNSTLRDNSSSSSSSTSSSVTNWALMIDDSRIDLGEFGRVMNLHQLQQVGTLDVYIARSEVTSQRSDSIFQFTGNPVSLGMPILQVFEVFMMWADGSNFTAFASQIGTAPTVALIDVPNVYEVSTISVVINGSSNFWLTYRRGSTNWPTIRFTVAAISKPNRCYGLNSTTVSAMTPPCPTIFNVNVYITRQSLVNITTTNAVSNAGVATSLLYVLQDDSYDIPVNLTAVQPFPETRCTMTIEDSSIVFGGSPTLVSVQGLLYATGTLLMRRSVVESTFSNTAFVDSPLMYVRLCNGVSMFRVNITSSQYTLSERLLPLLSFDTTRGELQVAVDVSNVLYQVLRPPTDTLFNQVAALVVLFVLNGIFSPIGGYPYNVTFTNVDIRVSQSRFELTQNDVNQFVALYATKATIQQATIAFNNVSSQFLLLSTASSSGNAWIGLSAINASLSNIAVQWDAFVSTIVQPLGLGSSATDTGTTVYGAQAYDCWGLQNVTITQRNPDAMNNGSQVVLLDATIRVGNASTITASLMDMPTSSSTHNVQNSSGGFLVRILSSPYRIAQSMLERVSVHVTNATLVATRALVQLHCDGGCQDFVLRLVNTTIVLAAHNASIMSLAGLNPVAVSNPVMAANVDVVLSNVVVSAVQTLNASTGTMIPLNLTTPLLQTVLGSLTNASLWLDHVYSYTASNVYRMGGWVSIDSAVPTEAPVRNVSVTVFDSLFEVSRLDTALVAVGASGNETAVSGSVVSVWLSGTSAILGGLGRNVTVAVIRGNLNNVLLRVEASNISASRDASVVTAPTQLFWVFLHGNNRNVDVTATNLLLNLSSNVPPVYVGQSDALEAIAVIRVSGLATYTTSELLGLLTSYVANLSSATISAASIRGTTNNGPLISLEKFLNVDSTVVITAVDVDVLDNGTSSRWGLICLTSSTVGGVWSDVTVYLQYVTLLSSQTSPRRMNLLLENLRSLLRVTVLMDTIVSSVSRVPELIYNPSDEERAVGACWVVRNCQLSTSVFTVKSSLIDNMGQSSYAVNLVESDVSNSTFHVHSSTLVYVQPASALHSTVHNAIGVDLSNVAFMQGSNFINIGLDPSLGTSCADYAVVRLLSCGTSNVTIQSNDTTSGGGLPSLALLGSIVSRYHANLSFLVSHVQPAMTVCLGVSASNAKALPGSLRPLVALGVQYLSGIALSPLPYVLSLFVSYTDSTRWLPSMTMMFVGWNTPTATPLCRDGCSFQLTWVALVQPDIPAPVGLSSIFPPAKCFALFQDGSTPLYNNGGLIEILLDNVQFTFVSPGQRISSIDTSNLPLLLDLSTAAVNVSWTVAMVNCTGTVYGPVSRLTNIAQTPSLDTRIFLSQCTMTFSVMSMFVWDTTVRFLPLQVLIEDCNFTLTQWQYGFLQLPNIQPAARTIRSPPLIPISSSNPVRNFMLESLIQSSNETIVVRYCTFTIDFIAVFLTRVPIIAFIVGGQMNATVVATHHLDVNVLNVGNAGGTPLLTFFDVSMSWFSPQFAAPSLETTWWFTNCIMYNAYRQPIASPTAFLWYGSINLGDTAVLVQNLQVRVLNCTIVNNTGGGYVIFFENIYRLVQPSIILSNISFRSVSATASPTALVVVRGNAPTLGFPSTAIKARVEGPATFAFNDIEHDSVSLAANSFTALKWNYIDGSFTLSFLNWQSSGPECTRWTVMAATESSVYMTVAVTQSPFVAAIAIPTFNFSGATSVIGYVSIDMSNVHINVHDSCNMSSSQQGVSEAAIVLVDSVQLITFLSMRLYSSVVSSMSILSITAVGQSTTLQQLQVLVQLATIGANPFAPLFMVAVSSADINIAVQSSEVTVPSLPEYVTTSGGLTNAVIFHLGAVVTTSLTMTLSDIDLTVAADDRNQSCFRNWSLVSLTAKSEADLVFSRNGVAFLAKTIHWYRTNGDLEHCPIPLFNSTAVSIVSGSFAAYNLGGISYLFRTLNYNSSSSSSSPPRSSLVLFGSIENVAVSFENTLVEAICEVGVHSRTDACSVVVMHLEGFLTNCSISIRGIQTASSKQAYVTIMHVTRLTATKPPSSILPATWLKDVVICVFQWVVTMDTATFAWSSSSSGVTPPPSPMPLCLAFQAGSIRLENVSIQLEQLFMYVLQSDSSPTTAIHMHTLVGTAEPLTDLVMVNQIINEMTIVVTGATQLSRTRILNIDVGHIGNVAVIVRNGSYLNMSTASTTVTGPRSSLITLPRSSCEVSSLRLDVMERSVVVASTLIDTATDPLQYLLLTGAWNISVLNGSSVIGSLLNWNATQNVMNFALRIFTSGGSTVTAAEAAPGDAMPAAPISFLSTRASSEPVFSAVWYLGNATLVGYPLLANVSRTPNASGPALTLFLDDCATEWLAAPSSHAPRPITKYVLPPNVRLAGRVDCVNYTGTSSPSLATSTTASMLPSLTAQASSSPSVSSSHNATSLTTTHGASTTPTRSVPLPPPISGAQGGVSKTEGAAIIAVGGFLGAVGAMWLQRSALLMRLAACDLDLEANLDIASSPTRLGFGPVTGRYLRGSIIANAALILALCLAAFLLTLAVIRIGPRPPQQQRFSLRRAGAYLSLPGWLLVPFGLLMQPTLSSAITLLAHSSDGSGAGDVGLGVFGVVFSVAPFVYSADVILRRFRAVNVAEPPLRQRHGGPLQVFHQAWQWLLWRERGWVDVHRNKDVHFVDRYGVLFDGFRDRRHWFGLIDMAASVVCGVVGGLVDDSTCDALLATLTAINIALLVLFLLLWPIEVRLEVAITGLNYLLGAIWGPLILANEEAAAEVCAKIQLWLQIVLLGLLVLRMLLNGAILRAAGKLTDATVALIKGSQLTSLLQRQRSEVDDDEPSSGAGSVRRKQNTTRDGKGRNLLILEEPLSTEDPWSEFVASPQVFRKPALRSDRDMSPRRYGKQQHGDDSVVPPHNYKAEEGKAAAKSVAPSVHAAVSHPKYCEAIGQLQRLATQKQLSSRFVPEHIQRTEKVKALGSVLQTICLATRLVALQQPANPTTISRTAGGVWRRGSATVAVRRSSNQRTVQEPVRSEEPNRNIA